jgi:protein SCO1/2
MRAPAFLIVILSASLGLTACFGPGDRREYPLQGQILTVAADHKEASVKHDDIPGFMAAMTMPYKVRDAAQFENLQPGDLITATLVVVSNDAYLKDVKKIGHSPLDKAPAGTPPASSGFELLKPGEPAPNTVFIDQDSKIRDFASFKNSVVLLTFIYTKCPMPTFCPLMDRHFKAIQEKVKADPSLKSVHLVSVSFDPVTDTPHVLKMHAGALGADPARWTFLTGDRDEIDKFAMRFGVSIDRNIKDPVDITHNLRTAIVDAKGVLVKSYTGNEWLPDQALADLKSVVAGN